MIFWASIGNFVEGEKSKSLVSSCIRVYWPISILFRWWNFPKTSTLLVSGFQISVRSNTSSSVGSQLGWHWKTFLRKPENFSSPMCQYWWWRFTALEKQSEQIGKNWRKSWGRWKKLGAVAILGWVRDKWELWQLLIQLNIHPFGFPVNLSWVRTPDPWVVPCVALGGINSFFVRNGSILLQLQHWHISRNMTCPRLPGWIGRGRWFEWNIKPRKSPFFGANNGIIRSQDS